MTTNTIDREKLNFFTDAAFEQYVKYRKIINPSWYFHPDGIHGVGHIKRVLIYAILLGDDEKASESDKHLLCLASIYHDIGRSCDRVDEFHGEASVKKAMELSLEMPSNADEKRILEFLIVNHCKDDSYSKSASGLKDIKDKKRAVKLYDIFNDCDALDRVRLKPESLDANYLRTASSKKYTKFNLELIHIVTSEEN